MREPRRRAFLSLVAAGTASLSGCSMLGDNQSTPDGVAGSPTYTESTATPTAIPTTPEDSVLQPTDDIDVPFGSAVAASGSTVFVGAEQETGPNGARNGAVYVFEQIDATWHQQAKLEPEPTGHQLFGRTLAVADDTLFVSGAKPRVDVYTRTEGTWRRETSLTNDGETNQFGSPLAATGKTLLVGAPYFETDDDGGPGVGGVYVFERTDSDWQQTTTLTATNGTQGDNFGIGLEISGETALVGLNQTYTTPTNREHTNPVYVFERTNGEWTQQPPLVPESDPATASFNKLALDGTTAVVGNPTIEADSVGTVYVFERNGGDWTQQTTVTPADGDPGDGFGYPAVTDSTAIVGAPTDDDPNGTRSGAAYVYDSSGSEWARQAKLAPASGRPEKYFGSGAALGDGFAVFGVAEQETRAFVFTI